MADLVSADSHVRVRFLMSVFFNIFFSVTGDSILEDDDDECGYVWDICSG